MDSALLLQNRLAAAQIERQAVSGDIRWGQTESTMRDPNIGDTQFHFIHHDSYRVWYTRSRRIYIMSSMSILVALAMEDSSFYQACNLCPLAISTLGVRLRTPPSCLKYVSWVSSFLNCHVACKEAGSRNIIAEEVSNKLQDRYDFQPCFSQNDVRGPSGKDSCGVLPARGLSYGM